MLLSRSDNYLLVQFLELSTDLGERR